jgi:hypothetical protein
VVFLSQLDRSEVTTETEQATLIITSQFLTDVSESCAGTLYTEHCKIWSATVNYPVILKSNVITFDMDVTEPLAIISNYTSPADRLVSDNRSLNGRADAGMLSGIYGFFREPCTTYATLGGPHSVTTSTWVSTLFYHTNGAATACDRMYYISPVTGMLSIIRSFLTYLSFNNANSTYRQTVAAQQVNNYVMYTRNDGILVAAVLVMMLGLLAAMALFWGFWNVNIYQGLGPIETGRAFGAPLLGNAVIGPDNSIEELLEKIGDVPVVVDEDGRLVRVGGNVSLDLAGQNPLLEQH